jgi:16S rRNA (guanine(966)-N(2))-methyltransferase RsmD
VRASRFLDVCAGSGAVGIEAISRGASHAALIESSRRARSAIEANLRTLGLADGVRLISRDAVTALKQLAETSEQFDIVFFDPPYASELYDPVMSTLAASNLISLDSIVIVEHRAKHRLPLAYSSLKVYRQVKQGESALSFYKLDDKPGDDPL